MKNVLQLIKFIRNKDLNENYYYRTLKFTKTQLTNSQELITQITTNAILKNTKTTLENLGCD